MIKKIVFFDIDGTLLDFGHKELSTKTLYTLKQLQKQVSYSAYGYRE